MRASIICFLAAFFLLASATPQLQYSHCKWFKGSPVNYKFYWSYNATHIRGAIEAITPGWIGLGISIDGSMSSDFKGSDVIVGWVNSTGQGTVMDYMAYAHAVPTIDPPYSQDVILTAAGQNIAGLTTIEFVRLLNTNHSDDRVFRTDGTSLYLIWAVGTDIPSNNGQAFSKHLVSGVSYVDLTQASTCPPSPPANTDTPIVHTWKSKTGDFTFNWAIIEQEYIEVTMLGVTNGWVGVGFSDTASMFYSDMIVGWVGDSDNITRIYDLYAGDQRVQPPTDESLGGVNNVQLISGIQTQDSNGVATTSIKWRRSLVTGDRFDLDIADRDVFVLYAIGQGDGTAGGTFSKHFENGMVQINLKEGTINTTVPNWVEDPRTTLRSTHGALMIVGWILFMTLGRFVAAYGRKIPDWWLLHVICNSCAMICITISLALILRAVGTQGEHFTNVHGIVGVVLVVGAFIQTALGAMAHFLRTTDHPLFPNKIHEYLGHIIWWGAVYNVPLGLRQYQIAPFTNEGNSFWAVWTCWLIIMVATTIWIFYGKWVERKQKQEDKARARAQGEQDPYDIYTTSHYDPSLINSLERVERPAPSLIEIITGNKVMTFSFAFHVGLVLALAILFSTISNTRPVPPYQYCPNCTEATLKFNAFNVPVGAFPSAAVPASYGTFCKGFNFDNQTAYHIVEIDPSPSTGYVAYMKLFAVPYDVTGLGTYACLDYPDEATPIYGWSPGMGPFVLPAQAGILVGGPVGPKHLILQITYENPQLLTNIVDSSGVVVMITNTLRPLNAGVMAVGATPSSISLPPNTKEVEIAGSCSPDKTATLTQDLTIFAVSHLTRLYGRLAWLEEWEPSGVSSTLAFTNLVGSTWTEVAYEPSVMMSASAAIVEPGDMLTTHCIYDTTSTNSTVVGGNGIFDELCWTWIWYYPQVNAIKCSSIATPYNPTDGHFRPDRNASVAL